MRPDAAGSRLPHPRLRNLFRVQYYRENAKRTRAGSGLRVPVGDKERKTLRSVFPLRDVIRMRPVQGIRTVHEMNRTAAVHPAHRVSAVHAAGTVQRSPRVL